MKNKDYNRQFVFDQSPEIVFNAINNVYGWWSEDFTGSSQLLNDEFSVNFGDVHYSKKKIIASEPEKKIVWLVTDSRLNHWQDKTEWTGTTIHFEIEEEGDKTKLYFTHEGLVPAVECFNSCSKGWDYFLDKSLVDLIVAGQGNPNRVKS